MYGKNQLEVKCQNLEAIRRTLYRSAPISRAQLAKVLHLTPATITNLVTGMIENGEVQELPCGLETEKSSGRKPIAIDLIPGRYTVFGVSLGRDETRWCITDMRGQILVCGTAPLMSEDYDAMLSQLNKLLRSVRTQYKKEWAGLLGIGLVVPGIVDSHAGVIRNHGAERISWVDQPLSEDIAAMTGLPVRMDNNVRARACAIDIFHPKLREDSDSYAFCHVSWGIACPLVLGERTFRGEDAAAGEMGKMKMLTDENEVGTLESLASADSILHTCRDRIRMGEETILTDLCPNPDDLRIHHVNAAQEKGDKLACQVLAKAMYYIGIALANIINIIDPHLVFLSGEVFKSETNVAVVKKTLMEQAFLPKGNGPRVVPVDFGDWGGAIGAAACCIEKHYIRKK